MGKKHDSQYANFGWLPPFDDANSHNFQITAIYRKSIKLNIFVAFGASQCM